MAENAQFPISFPVENSFAAADFIPSATNSAAIDMLAAWPSEKDAAPAKLLCGPLASGKSHLAHMWAARVGATTLPVGHDLESMRAISAGDSLLVDGIDGADSVWLFHVINWSREQGAFLLLTRRIHPKAEPDMLPDLRSRLLAMPLAVLDDPDDELLSAVVQKLFADRQLKVDSRVVDFILARCERNISAVRQIVKLADQYAMADKRAVTIPLMRKIFETVL